MENENFKLKEVSGGQRDESKNGASDKNRKRKIIVLISFTILVLALVAFFRYAGAGTQFIWQISNGGKWLFPLVTISALIDSINPCAFSILILTIAFLFSIGRLRLNILKIGYVYILGIFLIYIMIGLGILQTLYLFNTPHFMAKVGASLLILLGTINLINEFFPAFPVKLRIPRASHQKMAQLMEKGSLPTAFVLGMLVGICEFPCTGGPYIMILGLLHDKVTYIKGLSYLIFYNMIFVLPLILILLIASNKMFLEKVQTWKSKETKAMRFWSGVIMIILGLIIFAL